MLVSRKTLLAVLVVGLLGCPKKSQTPEPANPLTPPEEKASTTPDEPQAAPTKQDPATELAPTAATDAAAQAKPEAQAAECEKPKDCKLKGKPGKGMRWTCFESRCMAEPKGGIKKKKKRSKG